MGQFPMFSRNLIIYSFKTLLSIPWGSWIVINTETQLVILVLFSINQSLLSSLVSYFNKVVFRVLRKFNYFEIKVNFTKVNSTGLLQNTDEVGFWKIAICYGFGTVNLYKFSDFWRIHCDSQSNLFFSFDKFSLKSYNTNQFSNNFQNGFVYKRSHLSVF